MLRVSGFGAFADFERCWNMPSTVIRRFEYDPRSQALDVEFVSGRRYRYRRVPEDVATAFRGAFSKGRFFNTRIRDRYRCEEFTPEPAEDLWEL
jgi:lysyl-tRNA synthetase class 2